MKKIICVSIFCLSCFLSTAQIGELQKEGTDPSVEGGINTSGKATKNIKTDTKIEEYKIISLENDTTYVDTTLTVNKLYKYNYLRKDYFGLMPFGNTGQTFNTLTYNVANNRLMPEFGVRAKHFNYYEVEDINYYHVPTPFTELLFKTTMEQGQLLDALFTINTNKRFNFSIAYKGLRSLGKYQHVRANSGNFRASSLFNTKNERYFIKAHVAIQKIENEENGGITDALLPEFENGNEEFLDRSRFEVNFEDANNNLEGKRFYIDHHYKILKKEDSINASNIRVGHLLQLDDKKYIFEQTAQNDYFGSSYVTGQQRDEVRLEQLHNTIYIGYKSKLGDITFGAGHTNYNYGYNRIVITNTQTIPNRLKSDVYNVSASYEYKSKEKFLLRAKGGLNVAGDFTGNFLDGQIVYKIANDFNVYGGLNINSTAANFNFLLYQSDYINYNWRNEFENVNSQTLSLGLKSKKIVNAKFELTNIGNYTYFAEDALGDVKPLQYDGNINYLKLKVNKELKLGKFGLDNTVMYQKVTQDDMVFNVPEFITRNTLYYETHLFKKAMFIQTGIVFNYFTKYNMNAYDPLLGEFYVKNQLQDLGGFPRMDIFLNAKVRSARIFLKAEHVNSSFTGYNYYADPNNPYRDFIIRFGLVWDFFL